MRIGTVVTACDLNPLYVDFIPIFIRAWKKVLPEAAVKIVLIADSIPAAMTDYAAHIEVMHPLPGVHTAFQAQCVRLLYPRECAETGAVIITDMDMIPLNRTYYVDSIKDIADDAFVIYRGDLDLGKEIAICYNAAAPATWRSIFGCESTATILQKWHDRVIYSGVHGGLGWTTDQEILYTAIGEAVAGGCPIVYLTDAATGYRRLDRIGWMIQDIAKVERFLKAGRFSDYHCLRPYSTYKDTNDRIVGWLEECNFSD